MDIAIRVSEESKCPRKQVGAVVVTASQSIFPGFNGHASGGPNHWEDTGEPNLEVIHAENNCLNKMLEEGVSAKGSTIYTTLSCCLQCAKQLVGAKVRRVVYLEHYRDTTGLKYLEKYGVIVEQFIEKGNNERPNEGFVEVSSGSCSSNSGCCGDNITSKLQQTDRASTERIDWNGPAHDKLDGTGATQSMFG